MQSEIYNRLNDVEKRLIQNEANIYGIQQYIDAKGAESNFAGQLHECMNVCNEINMDVVKKTLSLQ